MTPEQIAAVKLALEALKKGTGWMEHGPIITALRHILREDALDKMAENARELGLDYGSFDTHDLPGKTKDTHSRNLVEQQPADEPLCTAAMFDNAFLAKSGLDPNTPLYTRPQPAAWVSLTDEDDIVEMARNAFAVRYCALPIPESRILAFVSVIDAKLREKNIGEMK